MKITNNTTIYVACIYMLGQDKCVLRCGCSHAYFSFNSINAFDDGDGIIKSIYNKIMNGEITFPAIKNFNKNKVSLVQTPERSIIVYEYDDEDLKGFDGDKPVTEHLCWYNVEKIELLKSNNGAMSIIYTEDDDITAHAFCRYGAFWYLVANINEWPIIAKKFWWFTKLDTMLQYLFGKFENQAI